MDLAAISGDIERVIVTEEALQARIKELAAQIDKDYEGKVYYTTKDFNGCKYYLYISVYENSKSDKFWVSISSGKKRKEGEPEEVLNRELVNAGYDLCIIDEAHYLKNNESIRGKIMVELCAKHKIERVWLLTGTPVANRPMDFFNLLKIIKSPIANNWKYFAVRYCDGRQFFRTLKNGQRKQIWLTDGASNLEELANKTKNTIIRRLKTEVLDMPDKVMTPMHHILDKKGLKDYDLLWEQYTEKRKLEGKKTNELQKDLVELILLRQFIANQAIPYTIEMVENAIEMGRKVIVFTSFTDELEIIARNTRTNLLVKNSNINKIISNSNTIITFFVNCNAWCNALIAP